MIADIHKPDISTLVTRGHFYFGKKQTFLLWYNTPYPNTPYPSIDTRKASVLKRKSLIDSPCMINLAGHFIRFC